MTREARGWGDTSKGHKPGNADGLQRQKQSKGTNSTLKPPETARCHLKFRLLSGSWKTINVCRFKPLNEWSFVTAATGN